MNIINLFLKEMDQEAVITQKMLERIPDDKYAWKPHPKSMTIEQLSTHIAELPSWISLTMNTSELDFAVNPYEAKSVGGTKELLELFESAFADGRAHLEKATEQQLMDNWTMRNGNELYFVAAKHEVIRMTFNQITHHRAQLGVFLRLLDIPIPGSYGPSADDMGL